MTLNQPVPQPVFALAETAAPVLGDLPGWKLSDLYPSGDSAEYRGDLEKAASMAAAFEQKWKGKLEAAAKATGEKGIGAALKEYEALDDLIGRIGSFAGLTYFSDTSNPANGKLYGDAQAKLTDISSHLLFFTLELNRIDDATMDACMANDAAAGHYRPWLVDLRKDKPHQLDDQLEQLFLEKSMTSAAAFNRLFDETMADLRFDIDGASLPLEVTLNMLQEPEPETRKKAAEALSATFKANLRVFTLITNTLAKDKDISDRWRNFEDIADSRHLANRVEREVVDALAAAVKKAYPRLSHRYYAMKATWLGMEQMNYWDRNAPLPDTSNTIISWDEAKDTVLSAYGDFAPEMADIARRFFDEEWIDAPARPGKGALMCATPLTLAETASVFGEMLTFRKLLDDTKDVRERKAMLARKVEDMINTVVRQIAFYEFERKLHTARKQGELTSEQIGDLWLSVQAESLGPAIRISEGYETWWTYIPHFIHSPFYVYAYAFGDCLVNSLYAVYQKAESGFQEKYFELLRAGGTKHHSELLKPFGLDATDPSFWDKGLSMIEGLIAG